MKILLALVFLTSVATAQAQTGCVVCAGKGCFPAPFACINDVTIQDSTICTRLWGADCTFKGFTAGTTCEDGCGGDLPSGACVCSGALCSDVPNPECTQGIVKQQCNWDFACGDPNCTATWCGVGSTCASDSGPCLPAPTKTPKH